MQHHEHWIDLAISLAAEADTEEELVAKLESAGMDAHERAVFERTLRLMHQTRCDLQFCFATGGQECLDDNTIAEFVDGVLPRAERVIVEQHLAKCHACLHSAAHVSELAAELTPEPTFREVVLSIAQRALDLVRAPLEGFTEQALQPSLVLGGETPAHSARSWTLESRGVVAEFTAVVEDTQNIALTVQLPPVEVTPAKTRISLRADEMMLESCPMPANGRLTFYQLPPGRYAIEFLSDGNRPVEFGLQLTSME